GEDLIASDSAAARAFLRVGYSSDAAKRVKTTSGTHVARAAPVFRMRPRKRFAWSRLPLLPARTTCQAPLPNIRPSPARSAPAGWRRAAWHTAVGNRN